MKSSLTLMLMIILDPIGYVHNACAESRLPEAIKKEISEIEVLPEYAEGLQDIERSEYIDIVFAFHREKRTELITRIRTGEETGVFASRSPRRPNHLGITTVKLTGREGNVLRVEGADALDGSPVIDIKYCDSSLYEQSRVHDSIRAASPRADVIRCIADGDTRELLLEAARIHGHVCPGLALGVMGAARVMRQLLEAGEDIRDYTLTVEMRNCAVDGALFVTGCTPGTGRFVMENPENNCFYVLNKDGKGWKVTLLDTNREHIARHIPADLPPAEKGIRTLQLDMDRLLRVEEVE